MQILIENKEKTLLSHIQTGEIFLRENGLPFIKLPDGTVMRIGVKNVPMQLEETTKVRAVKRITLHLD